MADDLVQMTLPWLIILYRWLYHGWWLWADIKHHWQDFAMVDYLEQMTLPLLIILNRWLYHGFWYWADVTTHWTFEWLMILNRSKHLWYFCYGCSFQTEIQYLFVNCHCYRPNQTYSASTYLRYFSAEISWKANIE